MSGLWYVISLAAIAVLFFAVVRAIRRDIDNSVARYEHPQRYTPPTTTDHHQEHP